MSQSAKLMQSFCLILVSMLLCVAAVAPVEAQTATKQKVVVHLSQFGDNLHAVKMAVHLAHMMQTMDAEVTLLLDLEGVRLADKRQPNDLAWGKGEPIGKELDAFLKAGGQMLVCPHCAESVGLTAGDLRAGARIGKTGELPKVILAADKVLDY